MFFIFSQLRFPYYTHHHYRANIGFRQRDWESIFEYFLVSSWGLLITTKANLRYTQTHNKHVSRLYNLLWIMSAFGNGLHIWLQNFFQIRLGLVVSDMVWYTNYTHIRSNIKSTYNMVLWNGSEFWVIQIYRMWLKGFKRGPSYVWEEYATANTDRS